MIFQVSYKNIVFCRIENVEFEPNSHQLREVLLHYFISKKTDAESYRILLKVYGEHALSRAEIGWQKHWK